MSKPSYWITITREDLEKAISRMSVWDCARLWPWWVWVGLREWLLYQQNPIDYWGGMVWYPRRAHKALDWRESHPLQERQP
jgi:hypothetical protein